MKSFAVTVLGWVLVPFLALAQEKVALNTVTGVRVSGSTVEITSTQKPNFTTFTMTDPPRLVIDISEAILSGVPEELKGSGLITGLRTANYGSDASAVARVLIGYGKDVETDIQVSENNVLVVRVLEGTGPLVAQADTGAREPVQPSTGPTAAITDDSAARAAAAAQAEREAQQRAAAEAAVAAKQPEQERREQEERARAEAAKKAEEERRAQALALAEEKKRKEEEARAAAEAKKQAEAEAKRRQAEDAEAKRLAAIEERKRKQEEARAAAEAKKRAEAEEKRRQAEEAEAKRLALLEERKRKQEGARAAAGAKKRAEAEEKQRRAEEAEAKRLALLEERKRREERVGRVETPRRAEPVEASSASTSERRRTLEIVGFQQQAGASRVYVRTDEPVRYKVSERTHEIILELENTQIGKGNNTRALDTSFFDTAVARVDPVVGPDRSVRVSIKLKEAVRVQTRQEGNTISLEFPRPGR
jgi:colicin import membrane protein